MNRIEQYSTVTMQMPIALNRTKNAEKKSLVCHFMMWRFPKVEKRKWKKKHAYILSILYTANKHKDNTRPSCSTLYSCQSNNTLTKKFNYEKNGRFSALLITFMTWHYYVRRIATSSSPYIKTFSNCYFVDTSASFKEKQHHFKFHFTWARGTQFGKGPVLAVHLSKSISPFARNFWPWQHFYSTVPCSKL